MWLIEKAIQSSLCFQKPIDLHASTRNKMQSSNSIFMDILDVVVNFFSLSIIRLNCQPWSNRPPFFAVRFSPVIFYSSMCVRGSVPDVLLWETNRWMHSNPSFFLKIDWRFLESDKKRTQKVVSWSIETDAFQTRIWRRIRFYTNKLSIVVKQNSFRLNCVCVLKSTNISSENKVYFVSFHLVVTFLC